MSLEHDPIKPWFKTLEEMGEYVGIRFGQVDEKSGGVVWHDMLHSHYDGIGAFAKLLRDRGAHVGQLAKIPHAAPESWGPLIKNFSRLCVSEKRLGFDLGSKNGHIAEGKPPSALAWHVFTEAETLMIRKAARYYGVSVNSMLLRHLNKCVSRSLEEPAKTLPWMIPVNLRGMVSHADETTNHSSFVCVNLKPSCSFSDVHDAIYQKLDEGQHWASWKLYGLGSMLSRSVKKKILASDRPSLQWNVGGFSNLGVWDSDGEMDSEDCKGPWLFSPPVLEFQRIGAGCVTFQNRMSLMIQVHPLLSGDKALPEKWMKDWVCDLQIDIASPTKEEKNFD